MTANRENPNEDDRINHVTVFFFFGSDEAAPNKLIKCVLKRRKKRMKNRHFSG